MTSCPGGYAETAETFAACVVIAHPHRRWCAPLRFDAVWRPLEKSPVSDGPFATHLRNRVI